LPDSTPLTLTYSTDPTNPNSPTATCSDACPLAHDENVPFQDFLFSGPQTLSGFQLVVTEFYGEAAGLHLLQLLSSGAFAYASPDLNQGSCTSGLGAQGGVSTSTTQGSWTSRSVPLISVPGAEDTVLASTQSGATVSWSPFIAASGQYEVSLFTPGCATTNTVTCGERTTVTVTVQPGGQSTTINQNSNTDLTTTVFSGLLAAGTDVTVTLTNSGGGTAIADRLEITASDPGAPRGTSAGRGLFEWVLSGGSGEFGDGIAGASSANATGATGLDRLSQLLGSDANVTTVSAPSGYVFAAGSFNYTASGSSTLQNILAYSGPTSTAPSVPGNGLNGNVAASVAYNGYLYVAGAFDAAADGSTTGLGGLARWGYSSSATSWQSIPGSGFSSGDVLGLTTATINGNTVIVAVGQGGKGIAAYDPSQQQWGQVDNFVIGSLSTVAPGSSGEIYAGGIVDAALSYAAPGSATLQDGKNGAVIAPWNFSMSEASSTTSALSRRSDEAWWKANYVRSLLGNLRARATPPVSIDVPSALDSAGTNQVLAGTFWSNSSADNHQSILVGGRFTTTTGVSNIGSYDPNGGTSLNALPNCDVEGTVKALEVVEDMLWIGGDITVGTGAQGVVTYDLVQNQLVSSQTKLAGT
jgi:hypothetical protein